MTGSAIDGVGAEDRAGRRTLAQTSPYPVAEPGFALFRDQQPTNIAAVESRRLDIKPYLRTLEEQAVGQTNELLKVQTREYIDFIKKFTETTNIMTKSFFIAKVGRLR